MRRAEGPHLDRVIRDFSEERKFKMRPEKLSRSQFWKGRNISNKERFGKGERPENQCEGRKRGREAYTEP